MFMQLDGKLQTQARETPRTFDFGDRTTFLVEPPIERTFSSLWKVVESQYPFS